LGPFLFLRLPLLAKRHPSMSASPACGHPFFLSILGRDVRSSAFFFLPGLPVFLCVSRSLGPPKNPHDDLSHSPVMATVSASTGPLIRISVGARVVERALIPLWATPFPPGYPPTLSAFFPAQMAVRTVFLSPPLSTSYSFAFPCACPSRYKVTSRCLQPRVYLVHLSSRVFS